MCIRLALWTVPLVLFVPAQAQTVKVCFEFDPSVLGSEGPGGLTAVERPVLDGLSPLEAAIRALVDGPTPLETSQGFYSHIPPGTSIAKLDIAADSLAIDFSNEILQQLDESTLSGIFDQLRATTAAFPQTRDIRMTCQGRLLSDYLPPAPAIPRRQAEPAPAAAEGIALLSLSGRSVTLSPGHGRFWNGSGWPTARPVYCSPLNQEDFHNLEMMQYLEVYLLADGMTVKMARNTNKSLGNHSSGNPWWQMGSYVWLQNLGYPCSVYASSTGDCTTGTGGTETNDDIRARPLASDYDNTNIYISLHTNGSSGFCEGAGCPTGQNTFYDCSTEHASWCTVSQNLSNAVHPAVLDAIRNGVPTAWTDRGQSNSNGAYGEIRIPNRAAILIELGFHDTCDYDAVLLRDNFFRSAAMWGIYKGVCDYFGTSPTWAFYSDQYVSDTIPSTMNPGQSYPVSITFRNRGVLWNTTRGFRLGAVGDSDPFTAFNRVDLPGEVGPGQTCTFNFTMTAPATPGAYATEWQMVRDGFTWFGAIHSELISVGGGGNLPPSITQQPVSQSVAIAGTASFTIGAAGDPPLSYQWQKNGSDLTNGGRVSGATSTTLQITDVNGGDAAGYRCVVTNDHGTATSDPATLTVTPNVFIVESRAGGQNFAKYSEFGVWADSGAKSTAADVTPGIGSRYGSTYRSVAGEKRAFFAADLPAAGQYQVSTTWGNGSNRRSPIEYVITHAGGTASVQIDQTATVNTWVSLGTFNFNAGTNAGQVEINNSLTDLSGSMYADAVRWVFVIPPAPTITQHPQPQSVCPGDTAIFSVTASGQGTLSYQWQKNGSDLANGGHYSGVTTSTLTVSMADANDAASYRCVVSNAGGSTPSNAAALTLLDCDRAITAWRSVRTHTGAGDLSLALDAAAAGNGIGGATVEPRQGGIQRIEVDFDGPITLASPAGILVTGRLTSGGIMGPETPYPPASVVAADSDTLAITFSPALPDSGCYTIAVTPSTIAELLLGDPDVIVRSLSADATASGDITLSDPLLIAAKAAAATPAASTPPFDLNLDGAIDTADSVAAKAMVSSPPSITLCP